MNAQELRIGNWLHSNLTEMDFRVTSRDILNIEGYPNTCKPIPLTEEWLLKFGFKHKKCGMCGQDQWSNMDFWYIETISGEAIVLRGNVKQTKILYPYGTFIEYVHSLQNLYFALTGQELTIQQ